ncbi:MAG: rhomboid family intramembrane serine protease, partial [Kiritimatiellia bacterium]|nr:rhomboid family intramembrane serine protease [Kiritimatiellia bacterium]
WENEVEWLPADGQQTLEWIAVLSAARLDYRLIRPDGAWRILIPRTSMARARAELAAYEAETSSLNASPLRPPEENRSGSGAGSSFWVSAFLILFYAWFGPYESGSLLLRRAAADSGAILSGEFWRTITALTIHADPEHLGGNLLSLFLLGWAVCRIFGSGLGWSLILLAGIAGNTATAIWTAGNHLSVGASTACFGALGILTGVRLTRRSGEIRNPLSFRNRDWIPLAAGLAVLALFGTGPRSDLAAHAFGFGLGTLLGALFGRLPYPAIPGWIHRTLEMACLFAVLAAWRAVILHYPG